MKPKDIVYCINESIYEKHITKHKQYEIIATKDDLIRIKNNSGKLVWITTYCFSDKQAPQLLSIHIDDKIEDQLNDSIEVTVIFTLQEKRWTTFVTANKIANMLSNGKEYIQSNHFIIVEEITPEKIKKVIKKLDKQNELIQVTKPY